MRWRLIDLVAWMYETFGVSSSEDILGRELREMGYRWLTARPRHPGHDVEAATAFKKLLRGTQANQTRSGPKAHRNMVQRRSSCRTESQTHTTVGQAGNKAISAQRSTHGVSLALGTISARITENQQVWLCHGLIVRLWKNFSKSSPPTSVQMPRARLSSIRQDAHGRKAGHPRQHNALAPASIASR